jgi:hypothetical protein
MVTENQTDRRLFDSIDWELTGRALRQTLGEEQETSEGQYLCCRYCRLPITREDQRIPVQGQHEHLYSNPHGIVFHFGCFATAPGCQSLGTPSEEWSWFRGFSWQIAICKGCGEHLGWRYSSLHGDNFHGLILKHLTKASDPRQ